MPYVYKIKNSNDEFYFGVRWDYVGLPENDLWVNYFTSSSLVKEIVLEKGLDYFEPTIIKVFEKEKDALKLEYELIKENISNEKCLNRALGKCTIWDTILKTKVSKTLKGYYSYPENRLKLVINSSGQKNHNYKKNPWRNVNSNVCSWKMAIKIYDDFIDENWDLDKYGYGRSYLVKRYKIVEGTARKLIELLKNNWNPCLDSDYLLFLNEKPRC